jgi:hypothetical protein
MAFQKNLQRKFIVHCTETQLGCLLPSTRSAGWPAWGGVTLLAFVFLAGCGSTPLPAPAPAPPAPATRTAPAPAAAPRPAPAPASPAETTHSRAADANIVADMGPKVNLPAAAPSRNWDEFKRQAARRMVAASPKASYMGQVQPMLFGIPILEIELNADGSVRDISVTRPPANIDAQSTIDYAMEAIRRGAPYGDMSRLPKPWKWTEVFLFDDKRKFKPRSLE